MGVWAGMREPIRGRWALRDEYGQGPGPPNGWGKTSVPGPGESKDPKRRAVKGKWVCGGELLPFQ